MGIVKKNMGAHCTMYILNTIIMINQEKDQKVVRKYKGKEG